MADTFTCPRCGATSHNPNDVAAGCCGRCHDWTGVSLFGVPVLVDPSMPPGEIRVVGRTTVTITGIGED